MIGIEARQNAVLAKLYFYHLISSGGLDLTEGRFMKAMGVKPGDGLTISVAPARGGPVQTYNSYVGQAREDVLLVTVPVCKGRLVWLPLDMECGFDIYARDGLYRTRGSIAGYLQCNKVWFMRIRAGDCEYIQRRDLYRVDADFSFCFARPAPGGTCGPTCWGTCRDISGSGMQFVSNAVLVKNEVVIFQLPLEPWPITVMGKVLYVQPGRERSSKAASVYRVKFVSPSTGVQDNITQYVFDKQRELILRQRGRNRRR